MLTKTIQGFGLSPQQEHLWMLQQANKNSVYRADCTVIIEGNVDEKALTAALQDVAQRHEILRTTFHRLPGMTIPVQVIGNRNVISDNNYNLSSLNPLEQQAKTEAIFQEVSQLSFDFEEGPLLQSSLVTLSPSKHILCISLPAFCADSATLKNFVRELSRSYTARLQEEELSDEPLQYADFSEWQNELLEAEDGEIGREFWRKQDFCEIQNLKLFYERNVSEKTEFVPEFISSRIDANLKGKLEAIAQNYNTSASTFLLACWLVLLWRLTQQSEIIVGTAFDGRKYEELQEALGLFAKYLPLKCHLSEGLRFEQFLLQINESEQNSYKWQECFSWELIAKPEANLQDLSYCHIAFDFAEDSGKYTAGDVTFSIDKQYACIEKFKIKLSCLDRNDALITEFHYDSNLFGAEDINCLAEQFHKLVESAIKNPEAAIEKLEILSDRAKHQLLIEFNQTETDYPKDKCIHQLFEEQVKRTPDNIAVEFDSQQLTYAELNDRANQLAHYLQKLGVKAEVMVGICVERSLEMVIGILGILKAGGAYLPLDPAYPKERLAFVLEDTQTPVLLTQQRLVEGLPTNNAQTICLDTDWETIAQEKKENLANSITTENLAYVIYTSGSTGKPKGVQISHQNLVHSTVARITYYQQPLTSFLLLSSFAFDSSVAGIFWTLCCGGILFLPQEGLQRDVLKLIELIGQNHLSHLLCLPSLYALILEQAKTEELVSLRTVIVAGEALSRELIKHHLERLPQADLFNEYGPTEGTVWSSVYHCQSQELKTQVSIGRPIPNTQIYILDSNLQPVPVGVPGELYISGIGLARGYLNRPDLTAEKFIPNPFSQMGCRGEWESGGNSPSQSPVTRLYKTGDLARYLPDGNIEFLGRIDHQVKIRGFRIEIGEIEAVLSLHPGVREVVAIAREDEPGNKRLVAYIIPTQETVLAIANLSSFLREKLPEYMVPSAYVMLKALPLTPNGKIDRQNLPAPEKVRPDLQANFVAPRTPIEKKLAEIWAEVLSVEQVGIYDNFFELGGHSLLVTQLLARVRKAFPVDLSLGSVFEAPTVAGMGDRIQMAMQTETSTEIATQKAIDLNAEAVLDPTIRPNAVTFEHTTQPAAILLTGVTGFVGVFLLYELLQQTEADIYCLVRSADAKEGKKRIQSTLESYFLWDESLSYRIIPVVGDLSKPLLGLSDEQFLVLANKLDVIYHNGALVNFTYPYSALKAANVLGTQEILRLASKNKVKPVHFISTTSVFSSTGAAGVRVVREADEIDDSKVINGGYAQSKWVAEKLLTIARSRDIPVAIYRLGRISGHSQTGACNTNDHTFRTIKGCIQLGCTPNLDAMVNITPADYVGKAIVHLSKQKESLGKNFHLVNPQPARWNELANWIRSMGYPLKEISYESWQAKLLNIAENSPENALYPLVSTFSEKVSVDDSKALLQFDCQNTFDGLAETSIACPPVDAQLLSTYFSYLIRSGFLDAPVSNHQLEYSFPKN